jgi:kynurenine formamidase
LRPESPAGQAFRTKRAKQFTGMTNGLTPWVPVFSPSCSRMLVNGGRMLIRLLISSKGCAPSQVSEYGAIVVVSFPKPKGGSGFPARVFAILL